MDLSRYDWKFRLWGIPVRIQPSFWVLCVAFSPFLGSNGSFAGTPWLFGLVGWTAATLLAILLHELGHALVGRRLYGTRPAIDLGIGRASNGAPVFGGLTSWAPTYSKAPTRAGRAAISFAGPAAGFVGAFALMVLAVLFGNTVVVKLSDGALPIPTVYPLEWASGTASTNPLVNAFGWFSLGFVWISVFWGAINLAPIYPLDGGQIAMALFSARDPRTGPATALKISVACSVLLALLFYLDGSVFAAFFFGFSAYQNYRTLQGWNARGPF